jgi:putative membrane protein
MKPKLTIIGPAIFALASICLLQPVIGAEEEASPSEKKSPEAAETKASEAKASKEKKEKKSSLSAADRKFVENAAKGGMMEVAMGRVAAQRAQNNDVKQFGSRMVTDHSKANNELKSIASKKGVKLPAEPQAHPFSTDANYMAMMLQDHQNDLAEFQQEAKSGSDPDLKQFADKGSKMVAEHLAEAKRINRSLKRERSTLAR